jgi:hypothetical protein
MGGGVSRGGNVRNIHISGCDIESNMSEDTPATTANVLSDVQLHFRNRSPTDRTHNALANARQCPYVLGSADRDGFLGHSEHD